MKILYIATSFPEPYQGDTIYTDLAQAIHDSGHIITVVVAEQTRNKKTIEMKKERGFDVLRIVVGNFYDVSFLEKGITFLKLPFFMRKGIMKYLNDCTFDFILCEAPPVTNCNLVNWAKNKFKCFVYLKLEDIFPQNAVDLGILRYNSILYRYFKSKEKKLYGISDYIGCMSPRNKHYLLEHNPSVNPEKIEFFPNTKKILELNNKSTLLLRAKYSISKNACVFLFGGNMGRPQFIDLLCSAIVECRNNHNIFFLFVGRGTDRHKLEQTIKDYDINNALVIDNLHRKEYEQLLKVCDVGLIVLDPKFTIPNFPSRILSYMEYAKPVLAATDKITDLKEMIQEANCGEWVWSGDINGFVAKIKEMSQSKDLTTMGLNGRKYLEKNYRVENSVAILENHFI